MAALKKRGVPNSVIEEAAHEVAQQLLGEQVNTVHHKIL